MSDDADKAARFEEMFIKEGIANAVEQLNEPEQLLDGNTVICSSCGEPIPPARLKIKPDAVLCVECKSILERL